MLRTTLRLGLTLSIWALALPTSAQDGCPADRPAQCPASQRDAFGCCPPRAVRTVDDTGRRQVVRRRRDGRPRTVGIGTCERPINLSLDRVYSSSTEGGVDHHDSSCTPGDAPDSVFRLRVSRGGTYIIESNQDYDGSLHIRTECGSAATELGCNDDFPSPGRSMIAVDLQPGTYYVIADGFRANAGEFSLIVRSGGRSRLLQQCSGRNPNVDACATLGQMACRGIAGPTNGEQARLAFDAGCGAGGGELCDDLGEMYEDAECGTTRDFPEAVRHFQRGCEAGYAFSCYRIGNVFWSGMGGLRADHLRSVNAHRRGCELGHARSCERLGEAYFIGRGVPRDQPQALRWFEQSCTGGYGAACTSAGIMHRQGQGVPRADPATAALRYRRACDLDHGQGCNLLGVLHDAGHGVPENRPVALRYFQRACQLDWMWGCSNTGIVYRAQRRLREASEQFQRACEGDIAEACFHLGEMNERGELGQADREAALRLYRRACDAESPYRNACTRLEELERQAAAEAQPSTPSPGLATTPQACGQQPNAIDWGPVRVGTAVVLGRHRPVNGDLGWTPGMDPFIGRPAQVTALSGVDGHGCPVVRVTADRGQWLWRVRDLAIPTPVTGASGPAGGIPQQCGMTAANADFGPIRPGTNVTLAIHRPVEGDLGWTAEMSRHVGTTTRVRQLAGVDRQGCPVVRVDADDGRDAWRVRDLQLAR